MKNENGHTYRVDPRKSGKINIQIVDGEIAHAYQLGTLYAHDINIEENWYSVEVLLKSIYANEYDTFENIFKELNFSSQGYKIALKILKQEAHALEMRLEKMNALING